MRANNDLTSAECEQFDREGYVLLGRALTDEELNALQERMDDIMLGRVRYEGLRAQSHRVGTITEGAEWDRTLAYRKIGCLHKDPLFLAYFQKPLFRSIMRRYVGENVALQRDMFFNNYPHEGGIGFHQDGGEGWNWAYDPHPIITIWTALDRASEDNGCVRVIPGTHKALVPVAQVAGIAANKTAIPLEVEAGEAVLLHNWTLHGSERNESDQPRRAVTVCYCASETLHNGQPANLPCVFGKGALTPRSQGERQYA